eukprot:TRINITY_DN10713_c2_g1_i1.p6 TRINITY_DN10713_c2_g1~~TRINITY_DN10713_c2_g1_i1.p6  ORF type:complete len:111 (-),score=3.66 TRINITY_DN10713_c2_g1_i1:412-744(-)
MHGHKQQSRLDGLILFQWFFIHFFKQFKLTKKSKKNCFMHTQLDLNWNIMYNNMCIYQLRTIYECQTQSSVMWVAQLLLLLLYKQQQWCAYIAVVWLQGMFLYGRIAVSL